MQRWARWGVLPVLALAVAACGDPVRQTRSAGSPAPAETPAPTPTAEVTSPPPVMPSAPPPPGRFVLVVVDNDGQHPRGVPVRVAGPVSFERPSDGQGQVIVDGPAGWYTYEVRSGCTDDVQILRGSTGSFGIASDETGTGEIDVRWLRRFAPSGPAFSSQTPHWPVEQTIEIRFDVVDRCADKSRAPNRNFAVYRFRPAPNLEIIGQPLLTSDGEGRAWVRVQCLSEGPTQLVLYDSENPDDAIDLVEQDRSSGFAPSCGTY